MVCGIGTDVSAGAVGDVFSEFVDLKFFWCGLLSLRTFDAWGTEAFFRVVVAGAEADDRCEKEEKIFVHRVGK